MWQIPPVGKTGSMPILVWDDDPVATDPELTGTKFASLADVRRWPDEDRPALVAAAALTTEAWWVVVEGAGLRPMVTHAVGGDAGAADELVAAFGTVTLPEPLTAAIDALVQRYAGAGDAHLAVRSSAVAEDLPGRSFAGQYVTRLGVSGVEEVAAAYRDCLASAWRPGIQAYRVTTAGDVADVPAMAVAVQPMVHGGDGWAGAALSDGSGGVVVEAVRGLGDELMSGRADPLRWSVEADEWPDGALARSVVTWVRRAERRLGHAVEVEFALAAQQSEPVVLQLRHHRPSSPPPEVAPRWQPSTGAVEGLAVGSGTVRGNVCRLDGPDEAELLEPGGVLVTASTDPEWLPLLVGLGAVVTDHGGLTSHAAIVCRELGLLAVVGCGDATRRLEHAQHVEVRCEGPRGSVLPVA